MERNNNNVDVRFPPAWMVRVHMNALDPTRVYSYPSALEVDIKRRLQHGGSAIGLKKEVQRLLVINS
jgi:hypothetical protein